MSEGNSIASVHPGNPKAATATTRYYEIRLITNLLALVLQGSKKQKLLVSRGASNHPGSAEPPKSGGM